jgi:hypothetical protein
MLPDFDRADRIGEFWGRMARREREIRGASAGLCPEGALQATMKRLRRLGLWDSAPNWTVLEKMSAGRRHVLGLSARHAKLRRDGYRNDAGR